MMIFQRFALSSTSLKPAEPQVDQKDSKTQSDQPSETGAAGEVVSTLTVDVQSATLILPESTSSTSPPPQPLGESSQADNRERRFSFRPFSFKQTRVEAPKAAPPADAVNHKKKNRSADSSKREPGAVKPTVSNATKRAKESALIVRALIIGPCADPSVPKITRAVAAPQLGKVKQQLIQPKSANRVIAELRTLPVPVPESEVGCQTEGAEKTAQGERVTVKQRGPIHAVCLEYTESEVHERHFNQLAKKPTTTVDGKEVKDETVGFPRITSADFGSISTMLGNMRIVSLIASPDFGIGQPGDGNGILAGALPTAETVINGIVQITPQLMALGYTTGMSVHANHKGVYPPTDRISVLTYWWGLELVLPPPTLGYLSKAQSIADAIVNCLTALSMINNGVREILPFIRYIGQYIDFEFNSIQKQDKGKGVVCAATWIMPAAMVPRPWDFPDPPVGAQALTVPEVIVTPPTATMDMQQMPLRTAVQA